MQSFNKNNLPQKVFLSGADYFHLVLDKHAKKHGAGGNVMRKVFYFEKRLSPQKINTILKSSPVIYWLCNIKLVPGSLLKLPYWQFTDRGNEIMQWEHNATIENEIPEKILDRDITVEATHFIEADLVYYPSGACAFILSWNHILLDAKGTTLLFDHLNNLSISKKEDFTHLFPSKEKKPNIIKYIRNMYKVKRFVQNSSRPKISSIAIGMAKNADAITKNKTISFNAEETQKINTNAFKSGSRFGPTLYFVACCSHVINAVNTLRNNQGDIWLPVPYDGRLRGAIGPLISNCVSFLFYRITAAEMNTVPQTVKCLSAQMTDQIKKEIPQQYTLFLNMMRHIPLWLYYFIISRTGKGVISSFLYTSTGDNFNNLKSLFGEPIKTINMIPALTFPPGLTFVFLKHDDELDVNIAYSEDVINNDDLYFIEQKIKEILLTQH